MIFNQWCSTKRFAFGARHALEAIWNELISAGKTPAQISELFADLLDKLPRGAPVNLHETSFPQDRFIDWLNCQLGSEKWIVGRRNKKRVKEGFEIFLTQKRYGALKSYFSKEIGDMDSDGVSAHLTEPNQTLAQQRADTKPGQAFWGGTGPAGKTCRGCSRWTGGEYMAGSGLLRDATCGKYTSMMNGNEGARVPHYAKACKYYEAGEERPIQKPAKSFAAMATQSTDRTG